MRQVPTADERTDTRSLVIEATARLLHEGGAARVTTRAVAAAAGVQAPTIYRLFGDKEGLLEAVAEHVMTTYVGQKGARAEQEEDEALDPVAALRAGWHLHIDFAVAHPDLAVLLSVPGRLQSSPAVDAGVRVLRRRVHRLAAAGLLRVDERRAVDLVHAAGTGAVLAVLGAPPGERDLGLADAMYDAVAAAILVDGPAHHPAPGALSVAVAFGAVVPDLPALSPVERALLAEWVERSVTRLQDG